MSNVFIALIDPAHVRHEHAHVWFASSGNLAWATCPLTGNGVLRIVGSMRYPNSPGTPASVAALLKQLSQLPGHRFWPDSVTLLEEQWIDTARLLDPTPGDGYIPRCAGACKRG